MGDETTIELFASCFKLDPIALATFANNTQGLI